jgi:pimeloyl-ACP methyl ester carboxylesterase
MTDALADTRATPSPALPARTLIQRGVALAHLGLLGATEVTRLTAEMHATIQRLPLPWKATDTHPPEKAPLPYQLVTLALRHLAGLTQQFMDSREPASGGRSWGVFRSILNGVAGDAVRDWDSPLQQRMTLCNEAGDPLSAQDWRHHADKGAVLFIHGLCLSDREWQGEQHRAFVAGLREAGLSVAWLRYNTGRPIHENGVALAGLLERAGFGKDSRLTLIGHSMGGLVIRAATHHAQRHGQRWLQHLHQAAYLGSPHLGSPYERLGHRANRLLGLTPYTRPLMKIGNLRSNGIMDLRHGRVTTPDQPAPTALHPTTRHLLLAAHMGREYRPHWLGDGLVPVTSALGQHADAARMLTGDDVTRVQIATLGHLAMLGDARVYQALQEWMQPS